MNTATITALILGSLVGRAGAGPLADALKRHDNKDVVSLRAQRGDIAARCTLGAVYAQRNDLTRAALYLTDCDDAKLPDDVAPEVARIDRALRKKLRDSDLSVLEVVTRPESMIGEIDALPGETFTTPATLWLKPGLYKVNATKDGKVITNAVTTQKRSRAVIILDAGPQKLAKTTPTDTKVNFEDDAGSQTQTSGPPPDIKHKNMIRDKYLKGLEAKSVAVAGDPNAIEDPLVTRETMRVARDYWLGVRLGGGMFDDGAASARAGMSVAATGRFTLSGDTFLAGRLDWSRRGGEAPDSIDVIGASAGVGHTIVDRHNLGIALLAQLRGDLRLADERMTAPVSRAGVTAAAGVELALPRTPFTAGLRFEQGLTTIVPGARDRALLFELGVDWR